MDLDVCFSTTVAIPSEFPIFATLVGVQRACNISAFFFVNTHTFRKVLHMNQSETRCPRTGNLSNHISDMICDIYACQSRNILAKYFTTKRHAWVIWSA